LNLGIPAVAKEEVRHSPKLCADLHCAENCGARNLLL
jgi:hypothetical protein